jgi:hypothetical protein
VGAPPRGAYLGVTKNLRRPAEWVVRGYSAIATSLGLWVRFSDWSEEG